VRKKKMTRRASFRATAIPAAVAVLSVGAAALLSAPSPAAEPAPKDDGLASFETVRTVLQHPRCQNCHIPGDAPLQFNDGRVHAQNVVRGPDGKGAPGLPCSTCHGAANLPSSYGEHVPPGAPNWHLPPPEHKMVFIGLSSGELCRLLKDEKSNGGKNLDALVRHVDSDKLVLWGWNPGVGRDPVSISHDEFVARFKQWVAAGAPCAP
jgi:hypothetical protein